MIRNEAVDDALSNLQKVLQEQFGGTIHAIVCVAAQEEKDGMANTLIIENGTEFFEEDSNLLIMNHALMDWSIEKPFKEEE